jgi:hypothetical protein
MFIMIIETPTEVPVRRTREISNSASSLQKQRCLFRRILLAPNDDNNKPVWPTWAVGALNVP